tara:strand:+ start:112 stop:1062 length:951 start_codon:yes stop_codon:yes gene_type:complete
MQYRLKKISGDASFREFYRIQKGSKSSIIVFTKKDKFKNLVTYSAVNQILNKNGILAPKLISNYTKKNIIEISDLGKISFYDFIKNKKNKIIYYKKLIDIIIKIQKIKLKKKYNFKNNKIRFEKYNIYNLHKESDLFFDWYLKFLFNKKKAKQIKVKIKKELNKLYKELYFKNNCFTHRDFHAANIMISKKRFGLIDSQDAIIGNPLYDVASLIDDVRIKIPKKIQEELFQYYSKRSKFRKANLKNDFDILSVQRNLKILGIFVRLHARDKKSNYLKFLPYTWKLIEMRLKNPIFSNLRVLINKLIPKKKRKRKKF